jgi:hypothetical protein
MIVTHLHPIETKKKIINKLCPAYTPDLIFRIFLIKKHFDNKEVKELAFIIIIMIIKYTLKTFRYT